MISTNNINEFSTTKLVGGILDDFQDLIRQQFALIKAECLSDWQKTKEIGLLLCLSLVPAGSGTILLAFMLAHLLHWLTMPAGSDPASVPLWACYGIAGAILLGIGAALFVLGLRRLQSLNPLLGESAKSLEENVHWLKSAAEPSNGLPLPRSAEWHVENEKNGRRI
jgi:Putative Actinobacterial Holin-X, holin superfamily III